MTQRDFLFALLRDMALLALLLATIVAVVLLSPDWAAGAVAFAGVPAVVLLLVGSVVWDTRRVESRRREKSSDQEDASCPSERGNGPTPTSPGRPTCTAAGMVVRPDVCTAWVDSAWVTYFAAFRSWRRTRPGR